MAAGVLLLVVGGALRDTAWSGAPAQARVSAVLPLLGLGVFAGGWLVVGSGYRLRGSRLLGVSAAIALYESVGVLVVVWVRPLPSAVRFPHS